MIVSKRQFVHVLRIIAKAMKSSKYRQKVPMIGIWGESGWLHIVVPMGNPCYVRVSIHATTMDGVDDTRMAWVELGSLRDAVHSTTEDDVWVALSDAHLAIQSSRLGCRVCSAQRGSVCGPAHTICVVPGGVLRKAVQGVAYAARPVIYEELASVCFVFDRYGFEAFAMNGHRLARFQVCAPQSEVALRAKDAKVLVGLDAMPLLEVVASQSAVQLELRSGDDVSSLTVRAADTVIEVQMSQPNCPNYRSFVYEQPWSIRVETNVLNAQVKAMIRSLKRDGGPMQIWLTEQNATVTAWYSDSSPVDRDRGELGIVVNPVYLSQALSATDAQACHFSWSPPNYLVMTTPVQSHSIAGITIRR